MQNFRFFRITAFLEGLSFIILMGVAMPLKYIWTQPAAVSIIGMLHGLLFILYLILLYIQHSKSNWKWSDLIWSFIASLLPLGTFVADRKIYLKYA